MATREVVTKIDAPATDPAGCAPRPYRLSVRQYLRAIEGGILADTRIELLGGLPIRQTTKSMSHNYAAIATSAALVGVLPACWLVASGISLQLGKYSLPEPSIVVIPGPADPYKARPPHARESALVVQIAAASYPLDRGFRWRRYAGAKLPTYWIINLVANRVELYREPAGTGRSAAFRVAETYGPGAEIPVVIAGNELGRVRADDLLV